eukprot:6323514-Pyramimonas_sp.AAC.1
MNSTSVFPPPHPLDARHRHCRVASQEAVLHPRSWRTLSGQETDRPNPRHERNHILEKPAFCRQPARAHMMSHVGHHR